MFFRQEKKIIPDMIVVKHRDLKEIIKYAYSSKKPLFIMGAFGIGKSYIVREAAIEIADKIGRTFTDDWKKINTEEVDEKTGKPYFCFIDIRASQFDPVDVRGLPVPLKEQKEVIWHLPYFWPKEPSDVVFEEISEEDFKNPVRKFGIIFLDELNLAPEAVQSALYQLILDRRLGEYVLPPGYIIVSAGNPEFYTTFSIEINPPLRNRFIWCMLDIPTADEWIKNFAIPKDIDERIISFLTAYPTYIHYQFYTNTENIPELHRSNYTFPTPRSWEFASDLIKHIPIEETGTKAHDIAMLVCTAVGVDVGQKFYNFATLFKLLPEVKEILKDPKKAETKLREIVKKRLEEAGQEVNEAKIEAEIKHLWAEISTLIAMKWETTPTEDRKELMKLILEFWKNFVSERKLKQFIEQAKKGEAYKFEISESEKKKIFPEFVVTMTAAQIKEADKRKFLHEKVEDIEKVPKEFQENSFFWLASEDDEILEKYKDLFVFIIWALYSSE